MEETENTILNRKSDREIDTLITKSYPEESFFKQGIPNTLYNPMLSYQYTLNYTERDFPVECFRRTADHSGYCVYQVKEGGYCYLFFELIGSDWILHHSVRITTRYTKADFQNFKIGDPIAAVIHLEPYLERQIAFENSKNSDGGLKEYTSFHLLDDTLVRIAYQKNTSGNFVISDILYCDNFVYGDDPINAFTKGIRFDFSIRKTDYPNQ